MGYERTSAAKGNEHEAPDELADREEDRTVGVLERPEEPEEPDAGEVEAGSILGPPMQRDQAR